MNFSGERSFDFKKRIYSLGKCSVTFGPNTPFLKSPFSVRCVSGVLDLAASKIHLKHPATLIVDGKKFTTLDPKGSIMIANGSYEIIGQSYSVKKAR